MLRDTPRIVLTRPDHTLVYATACVRGGSAALKPGTALRRSVRHGSVEGHQVDANPGQKGSRMESSQVRRILVVANRTAATPRLLRAIDARAAAGPCEFALLIPDATDRTAANWTLEDALPLMRQAAHARAEGLIGGPTHSRRFGARSAMGASTRLSFRCAETDIEVAAARPRPSGAGARPPSDDGRSRR
jgi:hypothetical protein